jgi:hypothetical protein
MDGKGLRGTPTRREYKYQTSPIEGNWKDDFLVVRRSWIQAGAFTVGTASLGLSSALSKTKQEQVEKYPP